MDKTHPMIPSRQELKILMTLWDNNPLTVHAILKLLGLDRKKYATIHNALDRMKDKGLIQREEYLPRRFHYLPLVGPDTILSEVAHTAESHHPQSSISSPSQTPFPRQPQLPNLHADHLQPLRSTTPSPPLISPVGP